MNRVALTAALLAALTIVPQAAGREDVIGDAAALYAAARYEEALATLGRASTLPGVDPVALHQYRALCLIALGERDAASDAFASLVDADPLYDLPASVAAPKVRAMFAEARGRQLPPTVRRLLVTGREAYEAGTLDVARQAFTLLAGVLDDPALEAWPPREDIRLLAGGFATLLADAAPANAVRNDAARGFSPASTPAPSNAAQGFSPAVEERPVEPPVAVMQAMPPWVPPSDPSGKRDYRGVLRIEIGVDGRVTAARIEEPTHPAYDVRLLHVARQWVFRPATRDGEPVESEQVIAVQLHPRD
jgi:hypothetical protein